MQALVARHLIPEGGVERIRSFSVFARDRTQRLNRASQIKFIAFPFWSPVDFAIPNLSRVPFEDGGHSNPYLATAGSFPFAAP
jgi:hypothetical protein